MALPSSGPITLQMLADEFGGTAPHSLSEYYRNGGLVPSNNTNVPESGAISLSNFYGAVNEILYTINTNYSSKVTTSTFFGGNWTSTVPKRLVISSGVTLGSSNPSEEALSIDSGMGGTLVVENKGDIIGAGGTANSGQGGDAVSVSQLTGVTLINTGNIYAGGGGGGVGGTGGKGGNGNYVSQYWQNRGSAVGSDAPSTCNYNCSESHDVACRQAFGGNARCTSSSWCFSCWDDSSPD